MSYYRATVVAGIALACGIYLLFSFIAWSFDAGKWYEPYRALAVSLWIGFNFMFGAVRK